MDWYFGNYWYLLLLLLLPILGIIILRFVKWRKEKKSVFADERFQKTLFEKPKRFSKVLPVLYLLVVGFLVISIVDVLKGNEEVKVNQKVSNVLFLLDVSNSMNVEDVEPDRLTLSKNIIVNTMPKLKTDKVGLVVFAGEATSVMPLTSDLTAAETYVGAIETSIMKVQGTDFLSAMQEAAHKFAKVPKGGRQIVLISDGEDNEGNEKAAIDFAKEQGMIVTTVGVGTEEGAPVPEYLMGQLMGYKTNYQTGETVLSKRETTALKNIASETGGSYIDGNNMEEATDKIVEALQKNSGGNSMMVKSQNAVHYYQYTLALSILFFVLIFLFNPKKDFNL